ncbi:hypothetical protein [Blastococcus mobilis]|nr:hypothetical protein [Blastococcus mobilis]
MMLRLQVPPEAGSEAMRSGRIGQIMQDLMDRLQPEAAYFHEQNGMRGASIVFDLESPALMPAIAEPLYQELGATVEFLPVMNMEDMQRALADVQHVGQPGGA